MQYIALIYSNEQADRERPSSAQQEMFQAYGAFTQEVKQAGLMVAGDALEPTAQATTVRMRDGAVVTTDGPFAETKEQLGGYYLLECKDLDQAIEWAAKIPHAKVGSIEIRPILTFKAE